MKPEVEALMLAGGRGSRMGRITESAQKCLLPIEGQPIIGHVMERLVSAFGSVDLKVAISHRGEDVKEYIEHNKPHNVTVTYVSVSPNVHDYYAYKTAERYLHGIFLALPGDILINSGAYQRVIEFQESTKADIVTTLSPFLNIADTHPVAKVNGFEVIEYLAKAPSKPDLNHLRDLMIFASSKKLFHYLNLYPNPEGYLGNVFQQVVNQQHSLSALVHVSPWLHIGYPEDLLKPLPF